MIQHDVVFPLGWPLIKVVYFDEPGTYTVTAPAGTAWLRVGSGGAGGFKDDADGWGGGAAFAYSEEACLPGAAFTVQVGDSQFARPSANTVAGDSWIKRADASVLVYADRGRPDGSPGLAANCTGVTKLDGSSATSDAGGASAGDDSDPNPMGFGGRGASLTNAPWFGGGGGRFTGPYLYPLFPPADGRICLEFYSANLATVTVVPDPGAQLDFSDGNTVFDFYFGGM